MNKATFLPLLWIVLIVGSIFFTCAVHKDIQEELNEPTLCNYKVAIIYRGQFRPGEEGEKDFYHSVTAQVEYLNGHGYEVFKLYYEYEKDMTQNLILRFAVIKYKKEKK